MVDRTVGVADAKNGLEGDGPGVCHFILHDIIIFGDHMRRLCQIPLIVIMGQLVGDTESCNEPVTDVLNELLFVSAQLPFSRTGVTFE